jgi:hypothetical protein
MREVDQVHDSEHQREARGDQKQHDSKLHADQKLLEKLKNIHRLPSNSSLPTHDRACRLSHARASAAGPAGSISGRPTALDHFIGHFSA